MLKPKKSEKKRFISDSRLTMRKKVKKVWQDVPFAKYLKDCTEQELNDLVKLDEDYLEYLEGTPSTEPSTEPSA